MEWVQYPNDTETSRTTYTYVYNGSQLTQMTVGDDTLYFTYGTNGPTTVTWNGTTYYYALNGQGDVTGIFNELGQLVVYYNWDNAWGYNPMPEGSLASTLGELNPLRYRSYVYDTETGYYYLQSRYYDPEIGRFINVDAFVSTGQGFIGNNMFAYCINNPVILLDANGFRAMMVCNMSIYNDGGGLSKNKGTEINKQTHTLLEKASQIADAFLYNLEFSAGIGQGIYGEFEVAELIGCGIGMYGNYGTVNYSQGEWFTGQEIYIGATAGLLFVEAGAAEHATRKTGEEYSVNSWAGINNTQESYTIFSTAVYPLFVGFSLSIGFDAITFIQQLDKIIGG